MGGPESLRESTRCEEGCRFPRVRLISYCFSRKESGTSRHKVKKLSTRDRYKCLDALISQSSEGGLGAYSVETPELPRR